MVFWSFGILAVAAALVAAMAANYRLALFSLWVCGMALGASFLATGSEFLAVSQWVITSVCAVVFLFYVVLFGSRERPANFFYRATALLAAACLATVTGLAVRYLPEGGEVAFPPNEVVQFGATLFGSQLLPLEILALTLFLVMLGVGVVSRSEGKSE
ncbi:MAG: NADH-quinone oxidoreductase subunit J [Bacteriovoracia bacterium]